MDKVVEEVNRENGWHVGIHVDAASGGFIAPFTSPDLKWDFRLKNVQPSSTIHTTTQLCQSAVSRVLDDWL